jgi:hypothetical protein
VVIKRPKPKPRPRLLSDADNRGGMDQDVLAFAGPDRLMLDDITPYGLRRKHIIRFGTLPDMSWVSTQLTRTDRPVHAWAFMDKEVGHLWICWKE